MVLLPDGPHKDLPHLAGVSALISETARIWGTLDEPEAKKARELNHAIMALQYGGWDNAFLVEDQIRIIGDGKPEFAFQVFDRQSAGFTLLGLNDAAAFVAQIKADTIAVSAKQPTVSEGKSHKFEGPEYQAILDRWASDWANIIAAVNIEDLRDAYTAALNGKWVARSEYEQQTLARILATDLYADIAERNFPAGSTFRYAPSDPVRLAARDAGIDTSAQIFHFADQQESLVQSNKGLLVFPAQTTPPPFDVVHWPDRTVAFHVPVPTPSKPSNDETNTAAFVQAVELVEKSQGKFARWFGDDLGSLFATIRHPVHVWHIFITLGGYGCSSRSLLYPAGLSALSALGVAVGILRYDALGDVQTVLSPGSVSWFSYGLALIMVGLVSFLALGLFHFGLRTFAIWTGTVLRAFGKQPIHGATNLPDTGQRNFLLRLLGHKD